MLCSRILVSLLSLLSSKIVFGSVWDNVSYILQQGVATTVYPGCVALVGTADGIVYAKAFGSYTYGVPPPYVPAGSAPNSVPPMTLSTLFDMASCTKVIATTSAAALLYQEGILDIDMLVSDPSLLGPAFAVNQKDTITVLNLLLHNAGFPPDPVPNYWDPSFGCPQTSKPIPAEDYSCRNQIFAAVLNQTLATPPNIAYVYSDISFITLALVVGTLVQSNNLVDPASLLPDCVAAGGAGVVQCYYEAYVRTVILPLIGMIDTSFLPPSTVWGDCAPAENDTTYEKKVIQGQVSDGNAYAMGGIAGHAGLFSNVLDIALLIDAYMFNPLPGFLTPATIKFWITEYNHTQSSRALGWNTNDPDVFDEGWDQVCGDKLSPITFLHTGYTGTMICGDIENEFYTVLLTNRVYPSDAPGSGPVHAVRQAFGDAVLTALSAQKTQIANGDHSDGILPLSSIHHLRTSGASHPLHPDHRPSHATRFANTTVIPKTYPLFKQCDPEWGNDVMENQTICQVGCLMSSVSMALNGWNITVEGISSDPASLNLWLQKNGGYVDGDDLEEEVIYKICPQQITYWGNFTFETLPATLPEILDYEFVVIANVNNGTHFVLVTGYSTSSQETWFVNDPGFNRSSYSTSDIVGFRIFVFSNPTVVQF